MERFARLVLHHRRIVFAAWLVLFVAGGMAAGQLSGRLTLDFSLARSAGRHGRAAHGAGVYGASSSDTFVATVTVPEGQTVQGNQAAIAEGLRAPPPSALPQARLVDYASTGDKGFVTNDGRTTYALIQGADADVVRTRLRRADEAGPGAGGPGGGFTSGLTSYGMLSAGGDSSGPGVLTETLLGAAGALVVLIFVFASFLALLAAGHRRGLDPHDVPAGARADDLQRRQLRRAVPHRADRPRASRSTTRCSSSPDGARSAPTARTTRKPSSSR